MPEADLDRNASAAARKQYREEQIYRLEDWGEAIDPGFRDPAPLSLGLTKEEVPVWQPPTTIEYDDLIGDEYAKKRKVVMDFTDGDRAKTTEFLDWDIEGVLNDRYFRWAVQMARDFNDRDDENGASFFCNLVEELAYDMRATYKEGYERVGAIIGYHAGEEEPFVECHNPHAPLWGGDPRIIQKTAEYNTKFELRMKIIDAQEARRKAVEEAAEREKASRRRVKAIRRKRAAQKTGAPETKRRQISSYLPPRKPTPNKEVEVHIQGESRDRCVGQDDDEEREEMEWLHSFEPSTQQSIRLRPLILQMVESCITGRADDGPPKSESTEDDVD